MPSLSPSWNDQRLSRRTLLRAGAAATAAALLPDLTVAAPPHGTPQGLIDPYTGAIPLYFPLPNGTYQTPLADNWHQSREGQLYQWSHRASPTRRSHDGVDVYPSAVTPAPTVYAPLNGRVAAVCWRSANTTTATVTYNVSATTPPPWDYSQAIDNVAQLPLYGNFVWLYSTDAASAGYFVFFCHLLNDATLQALAPDQPVTANGTVPGTTPVGTLSDSGNAAGTPQLHVEIHYPAGKTFTCTHCKPKKSGQTSIDPYASLAQARSWG